MRTMKWKWIVLAPLALAGLALFVYLGGAVVQWLWNTLLPPLFGLPTVTFWQALGLLALCRILFGGFGFHNSNPQPKTRIRQQIADRVADRVAERWADMTPEERERFRQRIRERCGFDPATSDSTSP